MSPRDSIGGVLDMHALDLLTGRTDPARQHRPTDRATLQRAALEMRSRNLTFRDIGEALGIGEAAARELLQETE